MKLQTIKSEGLAHNSYFLSDGNEAVVIDPRRDCEIYTQLAKQECVKITYILETHRNEDYVVGSLELQNMTEAEIGHSKELPFKYGEQNLVDNDSLNLGNTRIKALYTPGHTNESLSYLVYAHDNAEATMVFAGDTLFAGSVGEKRPLRQIRTVHSSRETPRQPARKAATSGRPRSCLPSARCGQCLRTWNNRHGTNHFGLREEN